MPSDRAPPPARTAPSRAPRAVHIRIPVYEPLLPVDPPPRRAPTGIAALGGPMLTTTFGAAHRGASGCARAGVLCVCVCV